MPSYTVANGNCRTIVSFGMYFSHLSFFIFCLEIVFSLLFSSSFSSGRGVGVNFIWGDILGVLALVFKRWHYHNFFLHKLTKNHNYIILLHPK